MHRTQTRQQNAQRRHWEEYTQCSIFAKGCSYHAAILSGLLLHRNHVFTSVNRPPPSVSQILQGSSTHGRRLRGGLWDGPPKFEVGDGPCIHLANILRSSVIGCVWKYELSKNRSHEEIFFLKKRFFVKKRAIYVIYQILDSKERQKT